MGADILPPLPVNKLLTRFCKLHDRILPRLEQIAPPTEKAGVVDSTALIL